MLTSESPWVRVFDGRPELALPLICDCPHGAVVPAPGKGTGGDTSLERLWGHAPALGATLISAQFPRSYVDVGPYRTLLASATQRARARWGCCWHLNLRSTQQHADLSSATRADVVLGDRFGTSCDAGFGLVVKQAIEANGYRVAVNHPCAGCELVRIHGKPEKGRHSLLIDIRPSLYLDEATGQPNAHFDDVRNSLCSVLEEVTRYIRVRCRGGAE